MSSPADHISRQLAAVIGPGYDLTTIRSRLATLAAKLGFSSIKAVRDGSVYGLFHNLMATPLNIVAVEALAKWINPSLFEDLDPNATIKEINTKFLTVPLEGIYLTGLR